jgi:hypothetical protein
MQKKNIEISEEKKFSLSNHKSYSINEVLAAGGANAFASKLGKNLGNLKDKLSKLPADAFFTDEEVKQAIEMLNESKGVYYLIPTS